ncbi:ABC transporter substrate-binding protein [Candidatus Bipolaricaulota bacterium]|nr:ABC transporter substrate-binding protein [Candidatus Bipolaricaulota bacterium]MBS3792945.1 ABC transporter substrate-binding protein [Candidatus Bipolaricaulota bacterium]
MNYSWKRGLILALSISLILSLFVAGLAQDEPEIKNPDTFVAATIGGSASTLDPAYIYDTTSSAIVTQMYENLVRFPMGKADADELDKEGYSLGEFKPMLATKVPTRENGLIRTTDDGKAIYEFPIKTWVTFHNGNNLSPEDVEYTFERVMIYDRTGGPAWMVLQPLTGYKSVETLVVEEVSEADKFSETTEEERIKAFNEYIDPAVEVDGGSVIFTLPEPYPPFMSILAHGANWSAILDKQWAIEEGAWPGTAETWVDYHDPGGGQAPSESPLYDKANGTGPFELENWDKGNEVVFTRYEDYWRAPAKLERVVYQRVKEFSTRKLKLKNGAADTMGFSLQFLPQVEEMKNVKLYKTLPTVAMNPAVFFTTDIPTENNDLVGSGTWGDGIPSNFFNDVKVRKAFAQVFPYQSFIDEIQYGLGYYTNAPIPKNMQPFYNQELEPYKQNMDKAKQLLKEAHGGTLWEKGFQLTILYNSGNNQRKTAGQMIEAMIEQLNPKFEIKVRAVEWSTFLEKLTTGRMPLFIIGWAADFPDPHNFAKPFAGPKGTFSGFQGKSIIELCKKEFDPLIQKGLGTTNTEKRQEAYYELQKRFKELVPSFPLPQQLGVRAIRTWVQDAPFNPMYEPWYSWLYPVYKGYE